MRPLQSFTGANDNAPSWVMKRNASGAEPSQDRPRIAPSAKAQTPTLFGWLLWLIPIAAFAAGLAAWWMQTPADQLLLPSITIGLVMLVTAAFARIELRVRDLCVLAATGAFATSIFVAASQSGITLYVTDMSVLISALSILLAWIFKSRPSLMLSGFSGLLWLASLNPDISASLGLGTPVSQGWVPLFPVLILAQAWLAKRLGSGSTLFVTIVGAYGFVAIVGASLSMIALVGLLFTAAAAHHRLGKAWADQDMFGSRLHNITGWIAALAAAHYIQAHWLNSDVSQAQPLWTAPQAWWLAIGGASFALFLSSIMRYKHAQITLLGIFLVSAAALIIPISVVRPDLVLSAFDGIPGLQARPAFGFMIGAAIMTSGLAWVVNGLRRGMLLDVILGSVVIGIQAIIVFNPRWITVDFGIVFGLSLIAALCVSGLIAGASLSHSRPAKRRA